MSKYFYCNFFFNLGCILILWFIFRTSCTSKHNGKSNLIRARFDHLNLTNLTTPQNLEMCFFVKSFFNLGCILKSGKRNLKLCTVFLIGEGLTVCSSPHQYERKFSGACFCRANFKHLPQPLNSLIA